MNYYEEQEKKLKDLVSLIRGEKNKFENVVKYTKDKEQGLIEVENTLREQQVALNELVKEKTQGFPWLAKAYAEFLGLQDKKTENYLKIKLHPAVKSSEYVKEIAKERRQAVKEKKVLEYLLRYYENLFPWLVDFRGEDLDDLIKQALEKPKEEEDEVEGRDPAENWLTKAEFEKLPRAEKFQLALDRYWSKKKSKWEIGRDYERYVGYLYEKDGYGVFYQGIVEGLADLGRDIIAIKDKEVEVIQCKYWSQRKVIHEKHICQFKGTTLKYEIENPNKKVSGKFFTSTVLSETAQKFAKALKIDFIENFSLKPYPSIKCNISRKNREKIYHLPFDQQYDKTLIEEERSECYVETVAEAENLGYRRAFRWQGEKEEK